MKKSILILPLFLLLFSCENASEDKTEGSSLIANENPDHTPSNVSVEPPFPNELNKTDASIPDKDMPSTTMKFEKLVHNFGTVMYPSENLYTFKFKNTGKNPLTIFSANASCGCTVPNKPEKPILPGETGELDVIFKPKEGQVGQDVTKTITVSANTAPSEIQLQISAKVVNGI